MDAGQGGKWKASIGERKTGGSSTKLASTQPRGGPSLVNEEGAPVCCIST